MTRWLRVALMLWAVAGPGWAPPVLAQADEARRQVLVMLARSAPPVAADAASPALAGKAEPMPEHDATARALAEYHGLVLRSTWPMPAAGLDCYVMRLPDADRRSAADVAAAVSRDARVSWAQPVGLYEAQAAETAQEPLYPAQPAARQWQLAALHRVATGRGVKVAVVDSGVDAAHPDLAGQLAHQQNFVEDRPAVPEGHGTAVAGIIAARADNGLGIAGVAPQARLLALRACWQASATQTLCTGLGLAKALYAALVQGADVINLSLGGPDDRLLGVLLDQAQARGATVVAALPAQGAPFPASHAGVLVVGAAPPLPPRAVAAPGRGIPTTAPGGGWTVVQGSSFAAAHAAGLLALVRELDPPAAGSARAQPGWVTDAEGRLDACATLARLPAGRSLACAPAVPGEGAAH